MSVAPPTRRSLPDYADPAALLADDAAHVWHPYASVTEPPAVYPVVSASGVRLRLADGRELIDGMSSWWAAIHGYNHPVLNDAVRAQLDSMAHVMFGGLTHAPGVGLARRLVELTPEPLTRVFFCDSGSVAVEVAVKMAFQYQRAVGRPERTRLLTVRSGYHGDTTGAMAVCDPDTGMHHLFTALLPRHLFAPAPACAFGGAWSDADIDADVAPLAALLAAHADEVAAVIVEPVVQGTGGMRFYDPAYLRRLRALADAHGALLILDEIATGFGRTGALFASEHAGISADILCLGKAMTGGYLSMAATLTTDQVASAICAGEGGAFMHGPTFMGNPIAAAVSSASIDLLLASDWQARVAAIERRLRTGLAPAVDLPGVADVRVLGAIGVVELNEPVDLRRVQPMFVREGVWIRPFGRLVYTMPPYVMDEDDTARLTRGMVRVLERIAA